MYIGIPEIRKNSVLIGLVQAQLLLGRPELATNGNSCLNMNRRSCRGTGTTTDNLEQMNKIFKTLVCLSLVYVSYGAENKEHVELRDVTSHKAKPPSTFTDAIELDFSKIEFIANPSENPDVAYGSEPVSRYQPWYLKTDLSFTGLRSLGSDENFNQKIFLAKREKRNLPDTIGLFDQLESNLLLKKPLDQKIIQSILDNSPYKGLADYFEKVPKEVLLEWADVLLDLNLRQRNIIRNKDALFTIIDKKAEFLLGMSDQFEQKDFLSTLFSSLNMAPSVGKLLNQYESFFAQKLNAQKQENEKLLNQKLALEKKVNDLGIKIADQKLDSAMIKSKAESESLFAKWEEEVAMQMEIRKLQKAQIYEKEKFESLQKDLAVEKASMIQDAKAVLASNEKIQKTLSESAVSLLAQAMKVKSQQEVELRVLSERINALSGLKQQMKPEDLGKMKQQAAALEDEIQNTTDLYGLAKALAEAAEKTKSDVLNISDDIFRKNFEGHEAVSEKLQQVQRQLHELTAEYERLQQRMEKTTKKYEELRGTTDARNDAQQKMLLGNVEAMREAADKASAATKEYEAMVARQLDLEKRDLALNHRIQTLTSSLSILGEVTEENAGEILHKYKSQIEQERARDLEKIKALDGSKAELENKLAKLEQEASTNAETTGEAKQMIEVLRQDKERLEESIKSVKSEVSDLNLKVSDAEKLIETQQATILAAKQKSKERKAKLEEEREKGSKRDQDMETLQNEHFRLKQALALAAQRNVRLSNYLSEERKKYDELHRKHQEAFLNYKPKVEIFFNSPKGRDILQAHLPMKDTPEVTELKSRLYKAAVALEDAAIEQKRDL